MYGYFVRNASIKYKEVWEIYRLNMVNTWVYSCCWSSVFFFFFFFFFFCVMSWVMLLSNKRDFVRKMEKDMFRDMGSKIDTFFGYGEWENKHKMGNGVL